MLIRRFLILLFLFLMIGTSFYPAIAEAKRVIHVGLFQNFPIVFQDKEGNPDGIYIDLLREIATAEGWQLTYVPSTWKDSLENLRNRKIDLMTNITYTKERDNYIDFSEENVLMMWGQVYVGKGKTVQNILDLKGYKIAILKGGINAINFSSLVDKFEIECELIPVDTQLEIFEMTSSGQTDAGVLNNVFGTAHEGNYDVELSPIFFNPFKLLFAVPEGINGDLLKVVDKHLKSWKQDKASIYYTTLQKWYGNVGDQNATFPQWLLYAFAAVSFLVILLLAGMQLLNKQVQNRTADLFLANEKLRDNERRLRLSTENAGVAVWEYDLINNCMARSDNHDSLYGLDRQEIWVIDTFLNATHPDDRERSNRIIQQSISPGGPDFYNFDFRVVWPDKSIHWLSVSAEISSRDREGRASMVRGCLIDITHRKQTEMAYQKSEEKYRVLFNSVKDSIFVHQPSKDGTPQKIVEVNEVACKVYGYTREEILDLTPENLIIPGEVSIVPAMIKKVISEGQNVFETYHKKKNAEPFPVEVSSFLSEIGGELAILSIVRDITEKIKAEEDLRQAQKMEAIGTLAGGIAHDFNNILSSIIGFTELALDGAPKGTDQEDYLQEVYTAGKRAKDLVWQILTFARQTDEPSKPIQMSSIAQEVLKFIRSSIPTTVEIKQKIDSSSHIMGNSTQIHQIIMNLCTNAAHAMDDAGGTLQVELKDVVINETSTMRTKDLKPGDYIHLKVTDTGVGIPPEVIKSIFEPYYTTKAKGEGTGMGLAVVQGIVENCGGKISVKSKVGEGTSFSIFLPIAKQRTVEHQYIHEKLPTGNESVLFVDDEATIAKMGARILEGLGYAVTTRTSSVEALELYRAKPNAFDIVISDMTMPNMTGDVLAMELMKIRSDIPVILCTGYSKKITDDSAAEIGIKAIAYKPIVKADFAKTVRKVLDEAKNNTQEPLSYS